MHPIDLYHVSERQLDELRQDADHRRLLRLVRRTGRTGRTAHD